MNAYSCLYFPYSVVKNFNDYDNACISWFIYARINSVAPQNELIQDFDNIKDENLRKMQQTAVDEYFTLEEMNQFKIQLSNHPEYSNSSFSFNKIYLPIRYIQAPLSTIPRGNRRNFYPIYQEPGYNLSFKVVGFYLEKYNFPYYKKYEEGKSIYKLYNDPIPGC